MKPPMAERRPHPHTLHHDTRPDDYYWLRDREDPAVLAYLEAENAYADRILEPLAPLADALYEAMLRYIRETKTEVPVRDGPYFYYSRTEAGRPYRIYARKRSETREALEDAPEEVFLDLNALAGESDFYHVTDVLTSPDHRLAAFLENRDGSDRYTLRVKDLPSGTLLPEAIPDVFLTESVAWDAGGAYLFYVTVDAAQRPFRLWRHRIGSGKTDVLLYEEADPTAGLTISRSASGAYLFLHTETKTWSEVRTLRADDPLGTFSVVRDRRPAIEYTVEDRGDGQFWVLTNEGAENFRLATCPAEGGGDRPFTAYLPYDPSAYLEELHPFRDALLLTGRQDGLTQIWMLKDRKLTRLTWPDPLYRVQVGENRMVDTPEILITYTSFLTPTSTYALDPRTGEMRLLHRDEVGGGYVPSRYREERIWSAAGDGTRVPVSLVYREGATDGGPAPLLLYGYGAYGFAIDPAFDPTLIPLLDRGVVFAVAHVRGGSEMGRPWYREGKLMAKRNSFTDFVDVAKDLIARGLTAPDRLAARGRSAGGLLMGGVLNLAPELFRAVSAGVPFVDVLTTMLDDTIPLTSLEWDEWGNPAEAEAYAYMKSYSPYDNVASKAYPHLYVTAGLNDPRVGYFEPAKWVARLRAEKTDDHLLVLRTYLGAGHTGSSDRYRKWRDLALEDAFILDKITP